MDKRCDWCGGELPKGNQRFCSISCCTKWRNAHREYKRMPRRICPQCGQAFQPSHATVKYCSNACKVAARTYPVTPCPICGKMPSSGRYTYCSNACVGAAKRRRTNAAKVKKARRLEGDTPEELTAWASFYARAIRANRTPQPCQQCGSTTSIQRHHLDYRTPEEIVWLCASCHHRWHYEHPRGTRPDGAYRGSEERAAIAAQELDAIPEEG